MRNCDCMAVSFSDSHVKFFILSYVLAGSVAFMSGNSVVALLAVNVGQTFINSRLFDSQYGLVNFVKKRSNSNQYYI